jgi:hypothetical protein
MVALAEGYQKHGAAALNGGERHPIDVHVDAKTLRAGAAGRCEIEEGPAVPVETARRCADSSTARCTRAGFASSGCCTGSSGRSPRIRWIPSSDQIPLYN